MSEPIADAATGASELIFPEELEGTNFRLLSDLLWDAEEVQEDLGTDYPEYGRWLRVSVAGDEDVEYLAAPGELVDELQDHDAEEGSAYQVTRAEKSGSGEQDPYEINIAQHDFAATSTSGP